MLYGNVTKFESVKLKIYRFSRGISWFWVTQRYKKQPSWEHVICTLKFIHPCSRAKRENILTYPLPSFYRRRCVSTEPMTYLPGFSVAASSERWFRRYPCEAKGGGGPCISSYSMPLPCLHLDNNLSIHPFLLQQTIDHVYYNRIKFIRHTSEEYHMFRIVCAIMPWSI